MAAFWALGSFRPQHPSLHASSPRPFTMTSVFPRLHTARSPKNDHEFRHPIPSFLCPSHHRPNPFLFVPHDGTPSRPRLCLPPLPDAPLPFREFTFPPAWGTILDAPSRSLPPLAGTASLPAPAPLSAVRLSPRLPSIQSLLHPTSTIFRGGHVIQQYLSTPPGGDSTAVIGKYGPASSPSRPIVVTTGRRRATTNPRQPDEMGTSHKSFYLKATSEGSEDEDVRDASGVKKRKRRRGGNELPRDAHLRKYACELCGKMFSR